MKLMPASSARSMIAIDLSWSVSPHAPNIIAPRHIGLTFTPVVPSSRSSMSDTLQIGFSAPRDAGMAFIPVRRRADEPRRPAVIDVRVPELDHGYAASLGERLRRTVSAASAGRPARPARGRGVVRGDLGQQGQEPLTR